MANVALTQDVKIDINAHISTAANLEGRDLVGIQMPAAWDTAAITFQVSPDGATYQDAFDSAGTEVSITAVAAHFITEKSSLWFPHGVEYIKLRSGTAGTPVDQAAIRTITLVYK